MAFLVWEPTLSVGVWEIDRQHRMLIGLINRLHEAVLGTNPDPKLPGVFGAAVDCFHNHFLYEEAFMDRVGYAEMHLEQSRNNQLLDHLAHMRRLFDAGPMTVSPELVRFLKDWLTAHILRCSQGYAELAALQTPGLLITAAADEI